jgi:hypothetical protein
VSTTATAVTILVIDCVLSFEGGDFLLFLPLPNGTIDGGLHDSVIAVGESEGVEFDQQFSF